jgi:hypothetical protein
MHRGCGPAKSRRLRGKKKLPVSESGTPSRDASKNVKTGKSLRSIRVPGGCFHPGAEFLPYDLQSGRRDWTDLGGTPFENAVDPVAVG